MKLKLAITLVVSAWFSVGCTSLQKQVVCNEAERDAIVYENQRLLERKKKVENYLLGGRIPGEGSSFLARDQLEQAYVRSYNSSVDDLERRAATFNALCVHKSDQAITQP